MCIKHTGKVSLQTLKKNPKMNMFWELCTMSEIKVSIPTGKQGQYVDGCLWARMKNRKQKRGFRLSLLKSHVYGITVLFKESVSAIFYRQKWPLSLEKSSHVPKYNSISINVLRVKREIRLEKAKLCSTKIIFEIIIFNIKLETVF